MVSHRLVRPGPEPRTWPAEQPGSLDPDRGLVHLAVIQRVGQRTRPGALSCNAHLTDPTHLSVPCLGDAGFHRLRNRSQALRGRDWSSWRCGT